MNAEIALTFLERHGTDWWFCAKPHSRFDQLLYDLGRARLFQLMIVHFTPGSGYFHLGSCYQVSEDGMWFLAHLFVNYDEMVKEAGAKGRGFQETVRQCAYCGNENADDLAQCRTCRAWLCEDSCLALHMTTQHQSAVCLTCGKAGPFCCNKVRCCGCTTIHQKTCPFVQEKEQSRTTYGTYRESGSGNFSADDMRDAINRMFRDQAQYQFGGFGSFGRQSSAGKPPPFGTAPGASKEVRDAFTLLGLPLTATAEAIKKMYKTKALVAHPDHGGAHQAMVKLNNAKDIALAHADKAKAK